MALETVGKTDKAAVTKAAALSPSTPPALQLPPMVFGIIEVRRLCRELEGLENYFLEQNLRTAGQQPALPRTSRTLETLAADNHLNLLLPQHRQQLAQFLEGLERTAPQLHLSFATDPSAAFVTKIVGWLRGNIHPLALVQIGRQPTIAAGCIVRTNSRTFDFSLRDRFSASRPQLLSSLEQVVRR